MKKTYFGLNYYDKLDYLIETCIGLANEHKYQDFYFICESPILAEKRFFQYTNQLVNIKVLSYSQYLNLMINKHHLNHFKIVNTTELVYLIYTILNTETFTYLTNPTFSFVRDLAKLMKEYELNQINYKATTSDKLNDFKHLYDSINKHLDKDSFLTKELIVCSHLRNEKDAVYFIDGDLFMSHLSQNMINLLEKKNDIYLFYNYSDDDRLLNMPVHHFNIEGESIMKDDVITSNLFKSKVNSCNEIVYKATGATPLSEVNTITSLIHQYIVDEGLRYKDFMVVYPNEEYKQLLIDSCNHRGLLHHLPHKDDLIYHPLYKTILKEIRSGKYTSLSDLSNLTLKGVGYSDPIYLTFNNYLSLLEQYDFKMSTNELFDFFTTTFTYNKESQLDNDDYIHLTDYNHPTGDSYQYVFYLGLNETILPETSKDQSLLLDEDLEMLARLKSKVPFNSLERQGQHENNILKAFLVKSKHKVFSYALTTLDNNALLPSTLASQLEKLFETHVIDEIKDLSLEELYLKGERLDDKQSINKAIDTYNTTKHSIPSIDPSIIASLYPKKVSVSQLEAYNKCPFQYFLKYGLNLQPNYTDAFMSNELGSLTHYVLEKCVGTTNLVEDAINEFINQHIDNNRLSEVSDMPINQYFIQNLKLDLPYTINIINSFIENSSYHVLEKELEVTDTIAGIPFRGFVDRIDSFNDSIMIIDYKPSTYKDINLSLAIQGFNIQMLLYLKAACKQLNKNPAAVLYFAYKKRLIKSELGLEDNIDEAALLKEYQYHGYVLKDAINDIDHSDKLDTLPVKFVEKQQDYKGNVITQDELVKLYDYIEEHINNLYQDMLKGIISLTPKGSENNTIHASINPCSYCDYKPICQIDHFYNSYTLVEEIDVDQLLGEK